MNIKCLKNGKRGYNSMILFDIQRFENITNSINNTTVTGTESADSITNTGDNVTITALGGDDTITNSGTASIFGGAGNDTIIAASKDYVEGGDGADYFLDASDMTISDFNIDEGDIIVATKLSSLKSATLTPDDLNLNGNKISIAEGSTVTIGSNYDGGAVKAAIANAMGADRKYLIWAGTDSSTLNASSYDRGFMMISSQNGGAADTVIGSAYQDTIYAGGNDYIDPGTGNDIIYISSAESDAGVSIALREGLKTVYNFGEKDTIITLESGAPSLKTHNNDLIVYSAGASLQIVDGASITPNFKGGYTPADTDTTVKSWATVISSSGTNTISTDETIANGTDSDDTIITATVESDTTARQINAGGGDDSIVNVLSNVTLNGGDGNDTIVVTDVTDSQIEGGGDNDIILVNNFTNTGTLEIDGDSGNDTISVKNITNSGGLEFDGDEGDDIISISDITNSGEITIEGDEGNDTINSSVTSGIIYSYKKGDGNDVINGFTESDTFIVNNGAYSITSSGDDVIVSVGDGYVTLKNAANLDNLNIMGNYDTLSATFVYALQQKTEAGYPIIAGLFFHPEEYHGFETLSSSFYEESETLTISSSDGLELTAYHYTPETPNDKWVILVHGYGHNHRHMNGFAMQYLQNNYQVLMVDQRAAGDSEGKWLTMGAAEGEDVALWTHKIAELNPNAKIVLHGVSMGAATAMLAAANPNLTNVTSLIEDCGYTQVIALVDIAKSFMTELQDPEFINWVSETSGILTGHKLTEAAPIDSIGSATMPSMFITGTADQVISPSMLDSLYTASGAEVKEIFTVEGATHGVSALTDSIGYGNAVFRFNAEAAGEGWITSNVTNSISLRGTKYDDTITSSGSNVTISTGAGNDTITNSGANNVYIYNKGDGDDVINGIKNNDTLAVNGAKYQVTISGNDKLVSIVGSENFITLKDAASITPNIAGTPIRHDRAGHEVENPVAMISSGDETYYYESVARATNDADNNSTVTVTANSTETSTINTTKGLTIQFAESGLGVYSLTGGNFVSADNSKAANFSISSNRVLSNSNSLLINNGATATLDGYAVTGTSNGYTFNLQPQTFNFNNVSYSGAGSATFDTSGNVSVTSGAVVTTTDTATINLAAGNYTLNGATVSATAAKKIYLDDGGAHFDVSSDTVTYNSMTFNGNGAASIKNDLPTLTAGVSVTRPERAMVVLTERGYNTIDGRVFQMTEKLSDGMTVGAVDNGIGVSHIVPAEDFPEDAGKTYSEEALIYGDDNYSIRLDYEGIRSIYGLSSGVTIRGTSYLNGEMDTLGSILQFAIDGGGVYTFGDKAYTLGGAIDSVNVVALTSRFYNDGSGLLRRAYYLNGTISGDFSSAVTINNFAMPVQILGDTQVDVYATDNAKPSDDVNSSRISSSGKVSVIGGLSNGASVKSTGGASIVSTDEEGTFNFYENQNFTIGGDNSVDFKVNNSVVTGIANFENGTLQVDNVSNLSINNEDLTPQFSDTATFIIADSQVISVESVTAIDGLSNATVHANGATTVNGATVNVTGDNDFNVIVSDTKTTGLSNISAGATVSVNNLNVTTDNNGEFKVGENVYTINDVDNSVTFITNSNGAVSDVTNFSGTLQTNSRNVTINGAALTTNDTDVTISSAGTGISQINGVGSGDVLSGDIDTAAVSVTVTSAADAALWSLNNRNYMLTGDNDGVQVTGNRIDGLDNAASLEVGAAGTYIVNNTALDAKINDTIIGTAEGSAYVFDPNNVPLDVSSMTDDEISAQVGISTEYSTSEIDTEKSAALINDASKLNGNMELALSNSDTTTAQTADFSNNTGKKKVTLAEGSQEVKFNDEGGNVAVIESDSEGEKNITLGNGGDLAIVKGTSTPVNITAGTGKDTIVTSGNNVTVDMKGGATKIVPNGGNVNLTNYDASTGAGIQVDEVSDIERAVQNGNINFGDGVVSFGSATVNLGNSESGSTTVNLFDNKGRKQKVAYTHSDGGTIDTTNARENVLLVGNNNSTKSNGSILKSGAGNDIAFGGAGDYFDLGAGNNSVYLNSNRSSGSSGATVAMTATSGTTEVNGFNSGFGENADKISINVAGANVSFKGGKLSFSVGGASLILNFTGSSADLIEDNNFIGESANLSDITPITYEQGDYQNIYDSNNNSLKGGVQITFTGA